MDCACVCEGGRGAKVETEGRSGNKNCAMTKHVLIVKSTIVKNHALWLGYVQAWPVVVAQWIVGKGSRQRGQQREQEWCHDQTMLM